MLDKFSSWIKDKSTSLKSDVLKFKNKDFLSAAIAGCAIVAAADGEISSEEKRKMIGFINQNDALKIFETSEVIQLFDKYVATFDFDAIIGKGECLKVISKIKKRPEEARLMILVCCAIGSADGNFDDNEKKAIREICSELGQNPSDFNL